MSSDDIAVTSPTPWRSPRVAAAAAAHSSSTTFMTPLMSKTLIYTNIDDEEDDEVAGATGEATESQPEESGVAIEASVQSGKLFCDVDNCPGQVFLPGVTRCLCEADVHMECFHGSVRKMKEYPEGCHDEIFCSDVCCAWHGNGNVNVEALRKERVDLQKL
jgi:hypothetical protein